LPPGLCSVIVVGQVSPKEDFMTTFFGLRGKVTPSALILVFLGAVAAACGGDSDDGGMGGSPGDDMSGGTSGANVPADCGDTFTRAAGSYSFTPPTVKAQGESHFASGASYDVEVSTAGQIIVKGTKKGDLTFGAAKLTCKANDSIMALAYDGDPSLAATFGGPTMKFLVFTVQVGTGVDGNVTGPLTKK
jgi:hypothetical protein